MVSPFLTLSSICWHRNMSVDVTALIILALFFIRGYTRGVIVAVFSVAAILLGILMSMKLSQTLASWMLQHGYTSATWAPMLSYAMLFMGVVLAVRLLAKMLQKMAEGLMLGLANRLAGGLLYSFAGAILFSSLLWLTVRVGAIDGTVVSASKTYPYFANLAPWFFSMAGALLPFAKDVFEQLGIFFDAIKPPDTPQ